MALRRYRLGTYRLVALATSFNTVWRVDTTAAHFVLRVGPQRPLHPPGAAALEDRWTHDLHDRGLPVPRIVTADDGRSSVSVDVDGAHECTVLTWRPGRTPTAPLSEDVHRRLAVLSARLHEASPPVAEQPAGSLSGRSVLHFPLPDRLGGLAGPARAVLTAARDRAQQAVDQLWRAALSSPRLIHTDLTPANVVVDRYELSPIDFQDASWGHVEQDIAHTIYGMTRGVGLAEGLAAFRAAYEPVRPWPALDLALLTDLVAARRLAMVNLAADRRRPDLDAYAARHAEALRAYVA